MELPESLLELIGSGRLAHLVTLNADGSPQVTIVWIGVEDDEIVSGHLFRHRKIENVLRSSLLVRFPIGGLKSLMLV